MNRELKNFVQPTILLVLLNVFPSVGERPLWSIVFAFVMLLYRWWVDFKNLKTPPRWFQWGVQGAIVLAVWQHFHSIFGDESAGCLLMLLTCVKTFELNRKRDFFITAVLCLLLLMSTLLLTQSLLLSVFLAFDVLIILSYLRALESETFQGFSWKVLSHPFALLIKSLPVMILIFFLFPRFSTGFGSATDSPGRTGISSELRPGSVSSLIPSDRLVFRATFLSNIPPRRDLYWRGAVLDISKGLNWDRGRSGFGHKAPAVVSSPDVEIYLEPGYGRFLFSLDTTVSLTFPNDLTASTLQQWNGRIYQLNQALQTRGRYYLYNADVLPDESADLPPYLAIEDKPSARMEQFLRPLRGKREVEVVNELLQNFHRNGYQYSLQPPPTHSIDEFFFETKTGFCEHYAASMATILRYLKIPSRVVVGFQGGTVSFLDNYVTVREHDAHAWLEYYDLTGRKWHRVDPTMQVAIERISMGSEAYIRHADGFLPNWVPANWALPYLKGRAFFDEMDASWIGFLLHFDMARQREWLQKLGMEEVMFRALPVFLILALTLMLALLYFFESHRPERLSAEERLYRQFLKQTKRWQFEKSAFEGLETWFARFEGHRPRVALAVRPVVERLIRMRFGADSSSEEDLKEIRSQLKDLRKLSIKA